MESSCSIKRGERGLERGFDEKKENSKEMERRCSVERGDSKRINKSKKFFW
jgi:hypothetical protein